MFYLFVDGVSETISGNEDKLKELAGISTTEPVTYPVIINGKSVVIAYSEEWKNPSDAYLDENNQVQFKQYEPDINWVRKIKLKELSEQSADFEDNLNKDMYFVSSLGFKCNGDRRTKDNLQDLITFFDLQAKEGKISYRDYDNNEQLLTKDNLQTLLVEHVTNGNALYAQKWAYEAQINAATTLEELQGINIEFTMQDFSAQS